MHLDNFLQKRVTTQAEQRWETAAFHGEFVKGIHPHNSIKSEFTKKKLEIQDNLSGNISKRYTYLTLPKTCLSTNCITGKEDQPQMTTMPVL